MSDVSTIILIIGYILAVPALYVIIMQLRKSFARLPSTIALVAEFTGTGLLIVGWFGKGTYGAIVPNALWFVVLIGICVRCVIKSKQARS